MDREVEDTLPVGARRARAEPAARNRAKPLRPAGGENGEYGRRELDWLDRGAPPEAEPRRRRFEREPARRDEPAWAQVDQIREGQRTDAALERDSRIRRALALADVTAAAVALACGIAVGGGTANPFVVVALPLVVVFCKLARLYDRDEHVLRKTTLDQAPAIVATATIYTLIAWLASSVFVDGGLTKPAVAVMWPVLVLGILAFRAIARELAQRTMRPECILVLGDDQAASRLRNRIDTAHVLRGQVVGRVPLDPDETSDGANGHRVPVLGPLADLDYILRRERIERVIIAPSARTSDELLNTIRVVKALGVKVSVLPRLFEVVGSSLEFDDIDGITILGLRRYGLSRTSWLLKRSFDLVLTLGALVVLAPLLVVIALAIRLTSPGPILFRQPRVGRRGERFYMFKFRTMYDGADEDKAKLANRNQAHGLFKIADDPRITPVGRFLRKTSLDELPQLINVVRGEMSLVGPRPLVEEEERKIAGWHHRRREGTPGMTGVWQVLGPTRVSLDDMVKLDYLYRANWSLWLDVKILLRTAAHVVSRRGL